MNIAIVGVGGLFPGARSLDEYWANIAAGRSAARPAPSGRWRLTPEQVFEPAGVQPDKVYSTSACLLDEVRVSQQGLQIDAGLLQQLDPLFHVTLEAGRQALADAVMRSLFHSRVSVVLGNIALPTQASSALAEELLVATLAEQVLGSRATPHAVRTHGLNRYVTGLPAGLLARALGLGGGTFTLDAACASSLYAIKLACDQLASGQADAVLAGGVSRPDSLYTQMGFCQLRALSASGVCRPFDRRADGLVVGEGAGVFVLKRLDDALRDQDRIYGVIRGIGLSNDLGGNLLAPDSEGQLRAMQRAYQQARWSPTDVDLIECHGTGTPTGDVVELNSLKQLFAAAGSGERGCVIGSVKSNVGHLLTGAGAAGLMKVLLAMQHGQLPPTASSSELRSDLGSFEVLQQARAWESRESGVPRRAAISAFGFGGINAHVLVEQWVEPTKLGRGRRRTPTAGAGTQSGASIDAEPIAIVGMDASFGPWRTLRAFGQRALGSGTEVEPTEPTRWWGVPGSKWLENSPWSGQRFAGYYVDQVEVPTRRFRIPPSELPTMLPQQSLMLQVAANALEDAGIKPSKLLRCGVFVGIGLDLNTTNFHVRWSLADWARRWAQQLGLELDNEQLARWTQQLRDAAGPALDASRTLGHLGGIVASRIARQLQIGGPSFVLSSEESSGLRAVEVAVRMLREGEVDQALVGAVDLAGDVRAVLGMSAHSGTISRSGRAQPLGAEADGTVVGEGAASLVLKRLADAQRDGDRIYAVIRGVGSASAGGVPERAPEARSYTLALERAYADAKVDPATVGYIEAHGSGIDEEDNAEAAGLAEFFSRHHADGGWVIGSVKADVGHAGAASGLAGLVKAALCLYEQVLPPLRNTRRWRAQLPGRAQLLQQAQHWLRNREQGPQRAGVSSMSVDGNCLHAVLEAAPASAGAASAHVQAAPTARAGAGLFAIEASDLRQLLTQLKQLDATAQAANAGDIDSMARQWWSSRNWVGGSAANLALVAQSRQQLIEQIECVRRALTRDPNAVLGGPEAAGDLAITRDHVFYAPTKLKGELALVYPGSGNHYAGMGRRLCLRWPEVVREQDGQNRFLRSQMAPERFWWPQVDGVRDSDHKQLILGQVSLGSVVTDLLQRMGVKPQAALGYSLGETASLVSLGVWRDRDELLHRMQQSELFGQKLAGRCDAARRAWKLPVAEPVDWRVGVVDAPAEKVRLKLPARAYVLIVNTPGQCVVGGQKRAIEQLVQELGCSFVPISGASTVHCEIVKQVETSYRQLHLLETRAPGGVRFYSCAWARSYAVDRESAAESITQQALHGFNFPALIEQAYQDGVRWFIEVGPGSSCSRMIGSILADREHVTRSALSAGVDEELSVLRVLAQLLAHGYPLNMTALYAKESGGLARERGPSIAVPVGGGGFKAPAPPLPTRRAAGSAGRGGSESAGGGGEGASAERPHASNSRSHVADEAVPVTNQVVHERSAVTDLMEEVIAGAASVQVARAQAHEAWLRLNQQMTQALAGSAAFQTSLLRAIGVEQLAELRPASEPVAQWSEAGGANSVGDEPQVRTTQEVLTREQCLQFAIGRVGDVLGQAFAEADAFPTRVRLPDEPLMLVDRITAIEGTPLSMTSGRVVTEHDVKAGAWYLDGDRIPTCIAVEAGQADLFLSGYLGIDLRTRGLAMYRLLDAVVTFHSSLPRPGQVIRYDIRIERFFRQGDTYLFKFLFDSTVDGQPLLTMRDGCAGFFTPEHLVRGQGVVQTAIDRRAMPGKRPSDWRELVSMSRLALDEKQIDALRAGDLAVAFGELFANLPLHRTAALPGGAQAGPVPPGQGVLRLIDRVVELDPSGGRFGMGLIRAEADIHPDDWFLTCHFVDDQVMPGTLMYECCLHTLRVLLMRMGWIGEAGQVAWEPVPGVESRLKCRGQVIASTKTAAYQVVLKEIGYRPEPYAIADALMFADGKPIVEITNMSVRLSGTNREQIEALWAQAKGAAPAGGTRVRAAKPEPAGDDRRPALFDYESILAFSQGNPSDAFGPPYKVFDQERKIARLPRPPFQFLDRITRIENCEAFKLAAGGVIDAQYDVPPDAWYFDADRQEAMPFAVLLETALQPCGWLAAYLGSALTSPVDLCFRNLGGSAVQRRRVGRDAGTLTTTVKMTRVSSSGGMIIQNFDLCTRDRYGVVYEGDTYFGFFSKAALAQQVGIREYQPYQPTAAERERGCASGWSDAAPWPTPRMAMIDEVSLFVPDGGPGGLGLLQGRTRVNPEAWFFQAHFYQDPVVPGSLGLESFVQLLKVAAVERWGAEECQQFQSMALGQQHKWIYRGQVVPTDREVTVQAQITEIDDAKRLIRADGYLAVDGRIIYQMNDFALGLGEST